MSRTDLVILEQLLIKHIISTEAVGEIEVLKPCLKLIQAKLELLQEGYILDKNETNE